MPYRLKDRNRQTPGGMFFYQPQTKWKSPDWASFTSIVDNLISHRNGNKWLNLPTDRPTVENEVDSFVAEVCAKMGWTDYIVSAPGQGDPVVPFLPPLPHLPSRLQNVAGGASLLVEWLSDGAEAVPEPVSTARAMTCAAMNDGKPCPFNEAGDFTRFFTVPLSEAIRKEVERRKEMKLSTPYDDKLGVCSVCSCPLKLKVHVPLDLIVSRMRPEIRANLHPGCWILKSEG
jgi:hypothetical protein